MKTLNTPLDLNDSLPYLLASIGAQMGNAFSKELKAFGLSLSEWRVCASLQFTHRQTLTELASNTSCDLSALSRIVDRLTQIDLCERVPNELDGRSRRVVLTKKGMQLAQEITPLARQYETFALEGLNKQESERLKQLLKIIQSNSRWLDHQRE